MYDDTRIYTPKQTNHLLHLILTFATCGGWGFVWLGVVMYNSVFKDKTTVRTPHPRAWYGQPVARPYAVGPGMPVDGLSPHGFVPEVPSAKMPPYVGYGSGYPSSMTRPPTLHPDLLVCDYPGCGWQTAFGAAMEAHQQAGHRATPHHPTSPQ